MSKEHDEKFSVTEESFDAAAKRFLVRYRLATRLTYAKPLAELRRLLFKTEPDPEIYIKQSTLTKDRKRRARETQENV